MTINLKDYVGRLVRLNRRAFAALQRRAKSHGAALENCFLVAAVGHGVHQLVCYGANFRIVVDVSDVVMV